MESYLKMLRLLEAKQELKRLLINYDMLCDDEEYESYILGLIDTIDKEKGVLIVKEVMESMEGLDCFYKCEDEDEKVIRGQVEVIGKICRDD